MGRALVIAAATVIIAAMIIGLLVYLRRADARREARQQGWALKGDLTRTQEQAMAGLLADADRLMRDMVSPPTLTSDLDSTDFLSPSTKDALTVWRTRYAQNRRNIDA